MCAMPHGDSIGMRTGGINIGINIGVGINWRHQHRCASEQGPGATTEVPVGLVCECLSDRPCVCLYACTCGCAHGYQCDYVWWRSVTVGKLLGPLSEGRRRVGLVRVDCGLWMCGSLFCTLDQTVKFQWTKSIQHSNSTTCMVVADRRAGAQRSAGHAAIQVHRVG